MSPSSMMRRLFVAVLLMVTAFGAAPVPADSATGGAVEVASLN